MTELLLQTYIDTKDYEHIRIYAAQRHMADMAAELAPFGCEETCAVLGALDASMQAQILSYLPDDFRVEVAEKLGSAVLASIMNLMSHDDRADLLKALPKELRKQTLQTMAAAEREDIARLASYPEDSIGSIMTTDYATLQPEITVVDAMKKLRREASDKETINRTYVIDEQRRLLGTVRLQSLIMASPSMLVKDIMEHQTYPLRVEDPRHTAATQITKYDVIALPVVDQEHRLVGIVTHDDALDVIVEEATEDFHKTSTIGKLTGNVRNASGWMMYRKRIYWLLLLVFGNLFSGAGIAFFENTISTYAVLVFFLPLLIGSGGNAGSQSATLMVRALATGDVVMKDWGRMLGREIIVSVSLGLTMAAAVSLIGFYRGGEEIALVVASSMLLVVMVGSLIGLSLPFLLSRLKLDPATASTPLITTIADAIGVVIYFTIATLILI